MKKYLYVAVLDKIILNQTEIFSYILFGVQSYHKSVRETLVSFMEEKLIKFCLRK